MQRWHQKAFTQQHVMVDMSAIVLIFSKHKKTHTIELNNTNLQRCCLTSLLRIFFSGKL